MTQSAQAPSAETLLIDASEQLAAARSMDEVVDVLRRTARAAVGAEGIAVVVREEGRCFYAAEDAISPLWAGRRFDEDTCLSGWAMRNLQTVALADVRTDPRIPQQAYAPTFVRSLIMAPIGRPIATAALGAYWSDVREHDAETVRRLESLARMAAIAIENARLLQAAEEGMRQRALMVAAGRMGMWSYDPATGDLETTPICRINFGRDPEQPFTHDDVIASIHPEDRDRVLDAIETSLTTGDDYDVEYRILTPSGEQRWIGIRAQPSHAPDGRAVSLDGLSIDITERKRMEEALRDSAATLEHLVQQRTRQLIETQDALRHVQKLDAMGQLTGGVAHDFNNLLTPIIGSLDLLQRRKVGGEREQRLLDGAMQSAERARTLVQRLLAFARRQPLKPEPVDVAALVSGMGEILSTTLGPQIALATDIDPNLPPALADPHQFEMAILNLAVNARDAMSGGGRLTVSARRRQCRRDGAPAPVGTYVVVEVADTGIGMDDETKRRAIEPFFSTKGVGQGTGLGLSMVHGLASQLGGALGIDTAPNEGTTISLWLPVSSARPASAAIPAVNDQPIAGRALVVDDEDLVRATTADMLVEMGFEVVEASNGEHALQMLKNDPSFDLLVTDHLMPGMTGVDLVRTATSEWPDLRALLVSGYSDTIGIDAALPRLQKPFRKADLACAVAPLMDADHCNATRASAA